MPWLHAVHSKEIRSRIKTRACEMQRICSGVGSYMWGLAPAGIKVMTSQRASRYHPSKTERSIEYCGMNVVGAGDVARSSESLHDAEAIEREQRSSDEQCVWRPGKAGGFDRR